MSARWGMVWLLALAMAVCAWPGDGGAAPSQAARLEAYPGRAVSFPKGVRAFGDIVYATHLGYRALTLDLYLPPGRARPAPLVIYVHGGSIKNGDSRLILGLPDAPAALAALAAR